MQIVSSKYINKQTPGWLICIAFLLSASLFTGYTGKAAGAFRQSVQTCRSWSDNYKKGTTNTAVYNYAPVAIQETNATVKCISYKFTLLHFSKLTQMKVAAAHKIFNTTRATHLLAVRRISNPYSEESPSLSFTI